MFSTSQKGIVRSDTGDSVKLEYTFDSARKILTIPMDDARSIYLGAHTSEIVIKLRDWLPPDVLDCVKDLTAVADALREEIERHEYIERIESFDAEAFAFGVHVVHDVLDIDVNKVVTCDELSYENDCWYRPPDAPDALTLLSDAAYMLDVDGRVRDLIRGHSEW